MRPSRRNALYAAGGIALAAMLFLLADPLNRLVLKLNWVSIIGEPWEAGMCGMADLPESTTPQDVLFQSYKWTHVRELRRVFILGPGLADHRFWLARVKEPGSPQQIFILQFKPRPKFLHPDSSGYWWIKEID